MSDINNMLTFGEKLEDALATRHITKKELAKAIGVSGATVSNWCAGLRMPTSDKIIKICLYLDIDLYDAFGIQAQSKFLSPKDVELVNKIKKLSIEKRNTLIKLIEHLSD